MAGFDLVMRVHGSESPTGDYKGRQWYVVQEATGIPLDPKVGRVTYSAEGQTLMDRQREAQELTQLWCDQLSRGDLFAAFLLTCPAGDRERLARNRPLYLSGLVTGRPLDRDADNLHRWTEFASGSLVRADKDQFWTLTPALREEITSEVRRVFEGARPCRIHPPRSARTMPAWTRTGDWLRFANLVQMVLPQGEGKLPLVAEGQVLVGAQVGQGPAKWRVEGLELLRGRQANNPVPGGGGPRRP
jgi:hypothetical protein